MILIEGLKKNTGQRQMKAEELRMPI